MHELYDLKDNLTQELKSYCKKDELNANSLEVIDKLAHALKNIDKLIDHEMMEEQGYSGAFDRVYAPYSYENAYSRGQGRYSRRDGRFSNAGGYSRADSSMLSDLNELAMSAPDERTRQQVKALLDRYR